MTVRQFHFTTWPDHGVPAHPTSLLAFHKKFRSFHDPTAGPAVVHCSAGVGRTGTFIAVDYLLDQSRVERLVDVFGCVRRMREKRVNMVQTVVCSCLFFVHIFCSVCWHIFYLYLLIYFSMLMSCLIIFRILFNFYY